MFHFEITMEGKAANEQWRDQALTFAAGAEAILGNYEAAMACEGHVPVTLPGPMALARAARLYEMAAEAYFWAAATTIGHKKTERYYVDKSDMKAKAIELYRRYKVLSPTYGTIPDWAK